MWKKGILLSQISQAKSVNKTPSKPQVKIRRYLTEKCRMNSQGHILHMGNDCCNKELLLPTSRYRRFINFAFGKNIANSSSAS